jgi:membrane fusion protein, multidrug efflux system
MRIWKPTLVIALLAAGGAVLAPRVGDPRRFFNETAKAATPPAAAAMPAMPVPVASVVKKSLPLTLDYSARTEAIARINLQAKISGYLVEQAKPDGADVRQGDLLYRIDSRDYDLALEQARAQLERDTANLDYLRSSLERGTDLAKSGFLSKDTYDQRTSAVRQAESALSIDRSAIRTAELNRSYTEIRAPFPGRLGKNQTSLGTLIGSGGTVLNTLVQIDPLYVTFSPSETDLTAIRKALAAGPVAVEVQTGESGARRGSLSFLDNAVDAATGTIIARATIPNADRQFLPGQYVRARVMLGEEPDTLMVPQVALGSSQLGKFVFVVGEAAKVEQRMVSAGRSDGDLVSILSGVREGEQVITGNLQKIGPGMPVQPLPNKVAVN